MEETIGSLIGQGRKAYKAGDFVKAERLLAQAIEQGAQKYADVYHALGVIYHTWGQFGRARVALETALEINPCYVEAQLNLFIIYNDLGRYEDAARLMEQNAPSAQTRVNNLTRGKIANLHAQVGDAYRSVGMSKEAAVEYQRALELCPSFADIRMRLVHALEDHGALDDALEQIRLVLLEQKNLLSAHIHLGLLLYRKGSRPAALEAFRAALEHHPGNERALAYIRMLEQHPPSE